MQGCVAAPYLLGWRSTAAQMRACRPQPSRWEGTVSPVAQFLLLSWGLQRAEEVLQLCDYSLHNVESRPAKIGEKLRTHAFNAWTCGFAAPENANTAVCLCPGTELAFAAPVWCRRHGLLGLGKAKVLGHTTAIFRQVNKDNPRTHHDALEFPDGRMVLLTDLVEGQEATVLQLPGQPVTATDIKSQERGLPLQVSSSLS